MLISVFNFRLWDLFTNFFPLVAYIETCVDLLFDHLPNTLSIVRAVPNNYDDLDSSTTMKYEILKYQHTTL
jgi:hypothetical protein